jgi:tetratricopeptide (TPR) repeat protein
MLGKDGGDLRQRGLASYQAGDYEGCLHEVEQMLSSDPQDTECLVLKGMALTELERPGDAVAALEQATRIDPGSRDGWYHLAIARMMMGELPMAAEAFRTALRVSPDDAAALTDLSNVLFMIGRSHEALETLQVARRLRPDDLSIARNLADMFVTAGQLESALQTTREILELSPCNIVSLSDAAWLNYQLNQLEEASVAFRALQAAVPDTDQGLYGLHGLVMTEIRRRNWRRALELAIEATRADRYEFTTLLLQLISSRLFDKESEITEAELEERFEAEYREHRRLCAEVPV